MAEIEQVPGELTIAKIIRGDDFAFSVAMLGDFTTSTFLAMVGSTVISTVATYSVITLKTTIVFSLTSAQTALMGLSTQPWFCKQTTAGTVRTILQGHFGIYER